MKHNAADGLFTKPSLMSEHQVLLKKQKNELFRIIEGVGLEPGNFEWLEEQVKGQGL